MWQRFTERARKVVFYAQEEAGRWGGNVVDTEHLLLGLIREDDSVAARVLDGMGVRLDQIRADIEKQLIQHGGPSGQDIQLTPRAKKVIDLAYAEVKRLKNNYVGTEHLLLGLIAEGEGLAAGVLTGLGMTLEATRERVQQFQAEAARAKAEAEELLTLDEAVKFLGTSKPTLYRLLGQDEIKGLKVGRQWRFRRADLIAYAERSPVAVAAAPKEDLEKAMAFFQPEASPSDSTLGEDAEGQMGLVVRNILRSAIDARASDIHLEPTRDSLRVRLRLDGVLHETMNLPASLRESLTAQIKTMAEMDVAEKRLPQDGRIPIRHEDKEFDMRVASIPSVYGEAVTIRILAKQDNLLGLDKLGLFPEDLTKVRDLMRRPNGLLLVTGPAGSGKTTLLYSCLQDVADGERKTVTVEDPVEYLLPGVTQVQVNKKAGLTYPSLLRALMRQDPDVLLVGEIPDGETAQGVAEAALTGHLVLSSLPANDAPSALLRLGGIGLAPHLVTAAVAGVVGMRLCRRVCDDCKAPADVADEPTLNYVVALAREGGYEAPPGATFYRGAGCERCRGRGYRGRVGLYEVLTMSDTLAGALLRGASGEELTALAVAGEMTTLLADGIRKAVDGQTTVEEVLRTASVWL